MPNNVKVNLTSTDGPPPSEILCRTCTNGDHSNHYGQDICPSYLSPTDLCICNKITYPPDPTPEPDPAVFTGA